MHKLKQSLFLLLLLELIFSYAPAVYAQTGSNSASYNYGTSAGVDKQITQYLCTPSNTTNPNVNPNSQDLFKCINQLYKFSIVLASVVGVFFIVIAGYIYMSAAGDSEGVTKAKDILVSTITALVILMTGYVLLQAIDPDLIQFQPIQPPAVTGLVVTGVAPTGQTAGGPITGTGPTCYIIAGGYNIAPYATAPTHEAVVQQVYNALANQDFSSAANITQYMQRAAPATPLTGAMILNSAQNFNIDPKLLVALMQVDSSLGTAGIGARTFNPGNVGNTDTGATQNYGNWQSGVDAVANWLSSHRATSC
jgi:hypothetical protein